MTGKAWDKCSVDEKLEKLRIDVLDMSAELQNLAKWRALVDNAIGELSAGQRAMSQKVFELTKGR